MCRLFAFLTPWLFFLSTAVIAAENHSASQCEVPAGYYRIANTGRGLPIIVRTSPSKTSGQLSVLHKDDVVFSDGLRVMTENQTWQRVRLAQSVGWIRAANLWRALPMSLAKTDLPTAGWCGDHSPLWSLSWTEHQLRLSLFPGRHDVTMKSVSGGVTPGTALVRGDGENFSVSFIYTGDVCRSSQGEILGWGRAHVLLREGEVERLFTGCCKADPQAFVRRQ